MKNLVIPDVALTPHQQAALDTLVGAVQAGQRLFALTGLAGTGKSTLIPALRAVLTTRQHGVPAIGAPTHRAAMILRSKGLRDAETIHSLAMTPLFAEPYLQALCMLGACQPNDDTDDTDEDDELVLPPHEHQTYTEDGPGLIAAAKHEWLLLTPFPSQDDLRNRARRWNPYRALRSIGVYGSDYLVGYGPKRGAGHIVIIDEASMIGRELLDICQRAFRVVILVGDPGQLPPVKDIAVLQSVPGVTLSEIHRQSAGSSLLRLAYAARGGRVNWHADFSLYAPDVLVADDAPSRQIATIPVLTWRNRSRIEKTLALRAMLGYSNRLEVGEPLVCRSTDRDERLDGYYNNALFRVIETVATDDRLLVIAPEDNQDAMQVARVHMEELDGPYQEPGTVAFRFAYVLTVHTAQGGEWPTVVLDLPELRAHRGMCYARGNLDEAAQWEYTAVTRARQRLILLRQWALR